MILVTKQYAFHTFCKNEESEIRSKGIANQIEARSNRVRYELDQGRITKGESSSDEPNQREARSAKLIPSP
jgi:hypothetical protein